MEPKTVFYVHGIRDDDPEQAWRQALDAAIRRLGAEDLAARGYEVVSPSYLDLLESEEVEAPDPVPEETYVRGPDDVYERAATDYFVATSGLERALGDALREKGALLGRLPDDRAVRQVVARARRFEQAERYVKEPGRRQAILARLAAKLPPRGDLLLIGHSLGSVVAADLVYHVPPAVRIRLLLTLGSPLARSATREHVLEKRRRFPYEHLGPWLNVVGVNDAVTGGRGIDRNFPEVLDVLIDTGPVRSQAQAHGAASYLDSSVVADAFAWTDHKADLAGTEWALAAPIPDEVFPAVVRAQYLLRLEQQAAPGERRIRLSSVRKLLAAQTRDRLRDAGHHHTLLDRLLMDNQEGIRAAGDRHHDLMMIAAIHFMNPIDPFSIEFDPDLRAAALSELALDLGVPRSWARTVIDCERDARGVHVDRAGRGRRLGLAAAGVLTIAVMPALVLAAAPAGLAGGAAFVAGLAALGPGGIAGGIALVGAVGGAGGGAVVTALLRGSPAEVTGRVVALQTLAKASHRLKCSPTHHREWTALQQMDRALEDERKFLGRYSDPGSPRLLDVDAKRETLRRAIEWMTGEGLSPNVLGAGGSSEEPATSTEQCPL